MFIHVQGIQVYMTPKEFDTYMDRRRKRMCDKYSKDAQQAMFDRQEREIAE